MASGYFGDDDEDYDDGLIYAEPKHVFHPGREWQPGRGSMNAWDNNTGRQEQSDRNPGMSVSTDPVSEIKHDGTFKSEKKSLYRCYLETSIPIIRMKVGMDIEGDEIFISYVSKLVALNIRLRSVRVIVCSELQRAWNVKVCDNLLYVTDFAKSQKVVLIMDKNGNVQSRVGLPLQEVAFEEGILGLAVDEINKDMYVGSENTNIVYRCASGSDHFKPLITSGVAAPYYLCVAPEHKLLVTNAAESKVKAYNSDGQLLWTYGGFGFLNGSLMIPFGLCADPWGNIYIADFFRNRVVQINSDGKFVMNIDFGVDLKRPAVLAFNNDRLVIITGVKAKKGQKKNKMYVVRCQFRDEKDVKQKNNYL